MTGYTTLVTSESEIGLGADVTVYGRTAVYTAVRGGSTPTPVWLPLDEIGDEEVGGSQAGFGGGLIGREQPLVWQDPDGTLSGYLEWAADEADLVVRVAGPDGRGGTYTFEGTVIASDDDETTAPLVYPRRTRAVRLRCGIGRASDVTPPGVAASFQGEDTTACTPALAALQLADLAPHGVVIDLGLFPPVGAGDGEATDGSAWRLVHYGLWAADDDLEARLLAVAGLHSLSVYLAAHDVDEDGSPRWHVVPRWRAGSATTATLTPADAPRAPAAVEASTYPHAVAARLATFDEAHPWDARREGLGRRGSPSRVTLTGKTPVQLARDALFVYGHAGYTSYWGGVPELSPGQAIEQTVVALTTGARLRVESDRSVSFTDSLVPVVPTEYHGRLRVSLRTSSGAVLWATAGGWQATADDLAETLESTPANVAEDLFARLVAVTPPLPEPGTLRVAVLAPAAGSTPDSATVYRVHVYAADIDGSPLASFEGALSGAGRRGAPATMPLPLSSSAAAASSLPLPVFRWTSPADGTTYDSLPQAALAERLAQSARAGGQRLRTFAATVPGLVGPDTRVRFEGLEPFETDSLEAVLVGGTVSRTRGVTDGVWCEVATSGLESGMGRPAVDLTFPEASP